MIEPERAVLAALLDRAGAVLAGLDEAAALVGPVPADEAALAALDLVPRTAAVALLKRVEQGEDVLMRLYRTLLRLEAVDTSGLFHRDIANRMEKLGLLADAAAWMTVVRLRNRLVHEYPVARAEQLARLQEAFAVVPILRQAVITAQRRLAEKGYL